jgi:predicted SnoaL-like aldol condensation-catalyzing enzyme
MSTDHFPTGMKLDVTFPLFQVSLTLISDTQMRFEIKEGPFAHNETVEIHVVSLGNSLFAVSWKEASGATVTNVQDYDRGVVHSHATLPDGQFLRMTGTIAITRAADHSLDARPQHNKSLVLDAMTSLFQRRDASAVERLYAPTYIQHNPGIPQGREVLTALVSGLPDTLYYEPGIVLAEGNFVAIHGRIRGWAEKPQVVIDMFRVEEGKLAEHWDVLQDEVLPEEGLAGLAMFDPEEVASES